MLLLGYLVLCYTPARTTPLTMASRIDKVRTGGHCMNEHVVSTILPEASYLQVLARLKTRVDEGAYYEAQQTYKSTFHRYKSKSQTEEACLVLKVRAAAHPIRQCTELRHHLLHRPEAKEVDVQEGASNQLAAKQVTCGSELLTMLLEVRSRHGMLTAWCTSLARFYSLSCFVATAICSQRSCAWLQQCARNVRGCMRSA